MKKILIGVGVVFLFLILILAVMFTSWGFRWFSAPIEGKVGMREQVQSSDFRKQAYNHFYDLCSTIQSQEDSLRAQYRQLENTEDEEEAQRIRANIAGLESQRMRNIRQYNQDARKEHTEGQFRQSDLPYQIPDKSFDMGVRTQCNSGSY